MADPIVFDSTTTNPGGTDNAITVTLPVHAIGDEIRISIGNTGNALWTGNPAGWERINQIQIGNAGNGLIGTWFRRKVLAGDSLPLTDPTFTLGATSTRIAIARTIRGADIEGPNVLPEWGARAFSSGTTNPIRPSSVVTPAPGMLAVLDYFQRAATDAPDQSGYTQDEEIIVSGTLVGNATNQLITDQQTTLANQDASPTSGARWVACIACIPSPDYVYYRSSTAALTTNGTSVTSTLPTGTSASDSLGNKDLIIATVGAEGTAPSPNTAGDWTEIATWSTTTSGGATTVRKYWALYDGTIDLQFNRSGSGEIALNLATYRNPHQTSPIGNVNVRQNASSTTSTWDAQDRLATKSTVTVTCVADGTPAYTAPAGWTERADGNGITVADQIFEASGSTASASFTLSTASPTAVGLVEIASHAGASVVNLVIQNAAHTHSAENVALTQDHELLVANGSHSHSADNIALTQAHELAVANAAHSHVAGSPTLSEVSPSVTFTMARYQYVHGEDGLSVVMERIG